MKKIIVLGLILVLAGCASAPMVKDVSQVQADVDSADCRREAGIDGSGGGFVFGPVLFVGAVMAASAAINQAKKSDYIECMKSKGYENKPNS